MVQKQVAKLRAIKNSPRFEDEVSSVKNKFKGLLLKLLGLVLIVGISYVILAPVIGIVTQSFFSNYDAYSPMVFTIPMRPTFERYTRAFEIMNYLPVTLRTMFYTLINTVLQVCVCSMVGYGFARFDFPFKKLLFGCVVIMIVIPSHTIMLPLFTTFTKFDPLGLVTLFTGSPKNIMSSPAPMYIMTALGCGLRSGLYIYIFNQFFRGLPREIEEAAFVDGAGTWYTYFRIMLVNALPACVTVMVFSLVWQYNDTFYARLFKISPDMMISTQLSSLQANIANFDNVIDPTIQQLYTYAGVVLVMLPVIILYLVLQRRFIEGVERSGIVG